MFKKAAVLVAAISPMLSVPAIAKPDTVNLPSVQKATVYIAGTGSYTSQQLERIERLVKEIETLKESYDLPLNVGGSASETDTDIKQILHILNETNALRDSYLRIAQTENSGSRVIAQENVSEDIESYEEKIKRLEREIEALKDAYIEGAPRRIKRIADRDKNVSTWSDRIEVGALIEIEAGYSRPYVGDAESDIIIATFAPYITSKLNAWISVQGALLYEQDSTNFEVDIAIITIANADKTPVYSIIGQTYMPFGNYDTNMLSNPLTLEICETRETGIQLGAATFGVTGTAYIFGGESGDNQELDGFGAFLGYNTEFENGALGIGLGYLNNLGESDALQDSLVDSGKVSGSAFNARLDIGSINIIGEYAAANDSFNMADYDEEGGSARPSAFNLEAGYSFTTAGKESMIAVAYQGSRQAAAIDLSKSRALATYSVKLIRNTGLLVEYACDTDYAIDEGGTGKTASALVAQLAVVF